MTILVVITAAVAVFVDGGRKQNKGTGELFGKKLSLYGVFLEVLNGFFFISFSP